jgi:hypothetical protein
MLLLGSVHNDLSTTLLDELDEDLAVDAAVAEVAVMAVAECMKCLVKQETHISGVHNLRSHLRAFRGTLIVHPLLIQTFNNNSCNNNNKLCNSNNYLSKAMDQLSGSTRKTNKGCSRTPLEQPSCTSNYENYIVPRPETNCICTDNITSS